MTNEDNTSRGARLSATSCNAWAPVGDGRERRVPEEPREVGGERDGARTSAWGGAGWRDAAKAAMAAKRESSTVRANGGASSESSKELELLLVESGPLVRG